MAWDIVSKEECASLVGLDPATYQDFWYEIAEGNVKVYLGTSILSGTASYDEYYDGNGTPILTLNNWPIKSVTAISIAGSSSQFTDWPSTGYKVYDRYIEIVGSGQTRIDWAIRGESGVFPVGSKNVRVQYTAGWNGTEPLYQRIREAMAMIINTYALYNARGGADASISFSSSAQPQGDRELGTDMVGLHHVIKDILLTTLPPKVIP